MFHSASVDTDYSLWVLTLRYEVKLGEISNIRYKTFNRSSVNLKNTTYTRQHLHNVFTQGLSGARNSHPSAPGIEGNTHFRRVTKGAFTRVPQVGQHGWINEIEFNGWTILFTRLHKSEWGSRFQNCGKWTCAGRCCWNMWLFNKRMPTHFRKKK